MLKLSEILPHAEKFGEVDPQIEETVKSYVKNHLRGLEYHSTSVGYAATRFNFVILDENAAIRYERSGDLRNILSIKVKRKGISLTINYEEGLLCIDVPNAGNPILYMGDGIKYLEEIPKNTDELLFYIGESMDGTHRIYNLTDPNTCHFLIGGGTGYGKSTCLHNIIITLLSRYNKDEIELNFIDLKKVTASLYNNIPQVNKIITEKGGALPYLKELNDIMNERNRIFVDQGIETIEQYDRLHPGHVMKRIVTIIDEADILLGGTNRKDVLTCDIIEELRKITAAGRNSGLHIILASQKPVNGNIPTSIKTNVHGRIAFKCESSQDSRSILENSEAHNKLTGVGDAITKYKPSENAMDKYPRTQIAWIGYMDETGKRIDIKAEVIKLLKNANP